MEIKLYNTLSRSKETFKPLKKGAVSMYHCGPTVYDTPHIGNYRTFILNDLIRRTFEYNGYKVDQAMNITDVDDKTIRRSREGNLPLKELTEKYEKLFLEETEKLNILRPQHLVRATEYILSMIELINSLIDKGIAYKASDGVYVSIDKVKNYGELVGLDLSHGSHERIANDEYDKENARDFAVWKFKTADDGGASWETPFGTGRPGWHIECSAMAMNILGPTIDIHTGGMDLIFPHHTNEIAQSESATGQTFVHYWLHGAFMNVSEEKMAKSKNNFYKLSDLLDESISPLGYRYWLLTAHYRSPVNFTFEAVRAAQTALIRLLQLMGSYPEGGAVDAIYRKRFNEFINDDLNIPQAVALAWELIKDPAVSEADKRATLINYDRVFGLKLESAPRAAAEESEIPDEVKALAEAREEARQAKDWKKADALRKEIEARGFTVADDAKGFKLKAS